MNHDAIAAIHPTFRVDSDQIGIHSAIVPHVNRTAEFSVAVPRNFPLTTPSSICLQWTSTKLTPNMTQLLNRQENNRLAIKFVVPGDLKRDLQLLAAERNIALSALLRLIASEYVRRNRLS